VNRCKKKNISEKRTFENAGPGTWKKVFFPEKTAQPGGSEDTPWGKKTSTDPEKKEGGG